MAENPQEQVRELRELVVAYAKQETLEPIRGLGRYVGFGLGAGILVGLGALFFQLGLLRVLQDQTGTTFEILHLLDIQLFAQIVLELT